MIKANPNIREKIVLVNLVNAGYLTQLRYIFTGTKMSERRNVNTKRECVNGPLS